MYASSEAGLGRFRVHRAMHDTKYAQFFTGDSIINRVWINVQPGFSDTALSESRIEFGKVLQSPRQDLELDPELYSGTRALFFVVFDGFGNLQSRQRGDDDLEIHLLLKRSFSIS